MKKIIILFLIVSFTFFCCDTGPKTTNDVASKFHGTYNNVSVYTMFNTLTLNKNSLTGDSVINNLKTIEGGIVYDNGKKIGTWAYLFKDNKKIGLVMETTTWKYLYLGNNEKMGYDDLEDWYNMIIDYDDMSSEYEFIGECK